MSRLDEFFLPDELAEESVRLTSEILKTCAVVVFALMIVKLVGV